MKSLKSKSYNVFEFFLKNWFTVLIIGTIGLFYLYFAWLANYELYNYYPNFVKIIDVISDLNRINYRILSFNSWEVFIQNYFVRLDGWHHGFITLFIPGIISYPFKLIWGVKAQLFVVKMSGALFLMLSYWIFALCGQTSKTIKSALFLIFIGLPYSNMFATFPRCESYQLFFIACFLFFFLQKRRNEWVYILLGLAFISRISTAPLGFFMLFPGLESKKMLFHRIKYLLVGVFLAQPHLLLPQNIVFFVKNRFFQATADTGIRPFVDYSFWYREMLPSHLTYPFLLYVIIVVGLLLIVHRLKQQAKTGLHIKYQLALSLIFSSVITLAAIMYSVKLENSYYLHFPLMMLFVGISWLIPFRWIEILFSLFALFIFSQNLPFSPTYKSIYDLEEQINYTQSSHFKEKLEVKKRLEKRLSELVQYYPYRPRVQIMITNDFFMPSTKEYIVDDCWSVEAPFKDWNHHIDMILLDYNQYRPKNFRKTIVEGNGEKRNREKSLKNYLRFVDKDWGGECEGENCLVGEELIHGRVLFYKRTVLQKKKHYPSLKNS